MEIERPLKCAVRPPKMGRPTQEPRHDAPRVTGKRLLLREKFTLTLLTNKPE
jgi:hypothetical protein